MSIGAEKAKRTGQESVIARVDRRPPGGIRATATHLGGSDRTTTGSEEWVSGVLDCVEDWFKVVGFARI
jgi:hypothetical protein